MHFAVCAPSSTHASLILPGKLMMEVGRALPGDRRNDVGQSPTYLHHPCFLVISQTGYIGRPNLLWPTGIANNYLITP
jgi:hypothetical protein